LRMRWILLAYGLGEGSVGLPEGPSPPPARSRHTFGTKFDHFSRPKRPATRV
jgi:hypothetical protein